MDRPAASILYFGLTPELVFERFWIWQPATYLFLHADPLHLLFNLLVLWMFGIDLERRWGQQAFLRYYFVCGIGAGLTSLAASWLPLAFADILYISPTIGASGAIYGLLLAFGLLFPERIIYFFIFPVPARIYVIIAGALVLWSSIKDPVGGTAHLAHLGGMVFGYLYLTWGRGGPMAEMKYRYTKWRMARLRRSSASIRAAAAAGTSGCTDRALWLANREATGLAALRVSLGVFFVLEGSPSGRGSSRASRCSTLVAGSRTPIAWSAWYLQHVAIPGAPFRAARPVRRALFRPGARPRRLDPRRGGGRPAHGAQLPRRDGRLFRVDFLTNGTACPCSALCSRWRSAAAACRGASEADLRCSTLPFPPAPLGRDRAREGDRDVLAQDRHRRARDGDADLPEEGRAGARALRTRASR